MKKNPLLLKNDEIAKHLSSLKSLSEKITYLQFLKKQMENVCFNYSDEQVKKFIVNNKLDERYNFCDIDTYINRAEERGDLNIFERVRNTNASFKCPEKFIGSRFEHIRGIIFMEILQNIILTLSKLTEIIEDEAGEKIVFTKDDFYKKYNSFKNRNKKLNWISDLSQKLEKIYWKYDDQQLEELLSYYNILKKYPRKSYDEMITISPSRLGPSVFRNFLYYLEDYIRGFVNVHLINLRVEIKNEEIKNDIKSGKLTDKEKYPLWEYRASTIKKYSEDIFPELADKIEYYSYVINQFYQKYTGNEFILDFENQNAKYEIIKLEKEFSHLNTIYNIKRNRRFDNYLNQTDNKIETIQHLLPVKSKISEKKPGISLILSADKLIWLGNTKQLIAFINLLQKYYFLETIEESDISNSVYYSVFMNDQKESYNTLTPQIIRWKTETSDLVYIFGELTKSRAKPFINGFHKWKKLSKIFVNQFGDKLNDNSLSTTYNKKCIPTSKESLDVILDNIYKLS